MALRAAVGVYLLHLNQTIKIARQCTKSLEANLYLRATLPSRYGTSKKFPSFWSSEKDNHVLLRVKEIGKNAETMSLG